MGMQVPNTFWGLLTAAVVVAILHAALPSHWLPFVLVGRTQGWSGRAVMAIVLVAGLGHVMMTSLLGLAAAAVGIGLFKVIGDWSQTVTAVVLLGAGGFYLGSGWWAGRKHHQTHGEPAKCHNDRVNLPWQKDAAFSDRAAFWSLFCVLTFSPCEGMVPFFFASARFGWAGLIALALVTGAFTVIGMMVLVALTQFGMRHLSLPFEERAEKIVTGVLLAGLGVVVLLWH
jgi:hypothetical protein